MKWILLLLSLVITSCAPHADFTGTALPEGKAGHDGYNAVVAVVDAGVLCSNGGSVLMTALDTNVNGILDAQDTHLQSMTVCNGVDGAQGQAGTAGANGQDAPPTNFTPVGITNPCGPQGAHDEIFLHLANNVLIASFSDNVSGYNTRWSILQSGTNYMTTDGTNCYFSVDNDGNLYNEHN